VAAPFQKEEIGGEKEKMDAKSAIIAFFIAAILVCTVAAVADTGQQNAGSVVTVTTTAPEVESITLNPDEIRITPGIGAELEVIAKVFGPNGIGYIDRVEITDIDPNYADTDYFAKSFPLPIEMDLREVDAGTRGKYGVNIGIINMPPGTYELTVTATDKEGNVGRRTAEFTVWATLAIDVTDVEFGALQVGTSSDGSSEVTNTGNIPIKFDKAYGISPSDMTSDTGATIAVENIKTTWKWKTVIEVLTSDNVEFTLNVPFGTPPGRYTGTIVFTPEPA
jgi:hypothetical protein